MICTSPTTEVTLVDSCNGATFPCFGTETIRLGTVPRNLMTVPVDPFPSRLALSPARDAVKGLVPAASTAMPIDSRPCALNSHLPRSYLQAALTPPSPPQPVFKTLSLSPLPRAAFAAWLLIISSTSAAIPCAAASALRPATGAQTARCPSAVSSALLLAAYPPSATPPPPALRVRARHVLPPPPCHHRRSSRLLRPMIWPTWWCPRPLDWHWWRS